MTDGEATADEDQEGGPSCEVSAAPPPPPPPPPPASSSKADKEAATTAAAVAAAEDEEAASVAESLWALMRGPRAPPAAAPAAAPAAPLKRAAPKASTRPKAAKAPRVVAVTAMAASLAHNDVVLGTWAKAMTASRLRKESRTMKAFEDGMLAKAQALVVYQPPACGTVKDLSWRMTIKCVMLSLMSIIFIYLAAVVGLGFVFFELEANIWITLVQITCVGVAAWQTLAMVLPCTAEAEKALSAALLLCPYVAQMVFVRRCYLSRRDLMVA
jgi:hypothetical protein